MISNLWEHISITKTHTDSSTMITTVDLTIQGTPFTVVRGIRDGKNSTLLSGDNFHLILSCNEIKDWDHVQYLRGFMGLRQVRRNVSEYLKGERT